MICLVESGQDPLSFLYLGVHTSLKIWEMFIYYFVKWIFSLGAIRWDGIFSRPYGMRTGGAEVCGTSNHGPVVLEHKGDLWDDCN
jgi:hypothetical protein